MAVTHDYSIKVKTDGGEQIDWDVSSGLYEIINIGDKLTKASGTDVPEVVEKAVANPQSNAQTPPPTNPVAPPSGPTPPIPPSA